MGGQGAAAGRAAVSVVVMVRVLPGRPSLVHGCLLPCSAATPASGREAPHVLEVLRAPDGSGPLFR